jgi:hypothetical protein
VIKWNLGRRELIIIATVIVIGEAVILIGGFDWPSVLIGVLFPLGVLFATNLIVGRGSARPDDE